jgi:RIO kinase 1
LLEEDEEFGVPVERVVPLKPDLGEDWERDVSLDVEDVHLDDPDLWLAEAREPSWVIRSKFEDEELGVIKSGKEADVTLVRRTSGERSCLLARKTYRPRAQRAFKREEDYRGGQSMGDERVDRAVGKRSRFGRSVLEYAWAYREFPLMRTAWEAGVRVPYPVESTENGLAMQYLGDVEQAAPRLSSVRLEREQAECVLEEVIDQIRRLLDAYLVHADLSAYNILWWDEKPWLIDFPQAADIAKSQDGVEFLRRDVTNVCRHFKRYGAYREPSEVFDGLMREAPFLWNR